MCSTASSVPSMRSRRRARIAGAGSSDTELRTMGRSIAVRTVQRAQEWWEWGTELPDRRTSELQELGTTDRPAKCQISNQSHDLRSSTRQCDDSSYESFVG